MIHALKTWPEAFSAVFAGTKPYELRKNDRNFQLGDTLILEEYDPRHKKYTDRWVIANVSYVTAGGVFGLPEDMIIMGLMIANNSDAMAVNRETIEVMLGVAKPEDFGEKTPKRSCEHRECAGSGRCQFTHVIQ